jgi:hypothetical protein
MYRSFRTIKLRHFFIFATVTTSGIYYLSPPMKTKLFSLFVVAAGMSVLGLQAQSDQAAPALAVDVRNTAPHPSQVVYSPALPSVNELTSVAAAQGAKIEKIIQSQTQVIVVYRSANGSENTVDYMLLSSAPSGEASAPSAPMVTAASATTVVAAPSTPASGAPAQVVVGTTTPTVVTVANPSPQVVYAPTAPAPAYYYDPYYGYYGYPWYGPVAVSVGFGYYYGGGCYYGGHYHGGYSCYHGGGGYHGGGHGGHH